VQLKFVPYDALVAVEDRVTAEEGNGALSVRTFDRCHLVQAIKGPIIIAANFAGTMRVQ
jgi:hypothetical protein